MPRLRNRRRQSDSRRPHELVLSKVPEVEKGKKIGCASNCPNCNWSPSWWTICAPTWCVISGSPYIGSKQSHILKVPHRKALRLRHPGLQIGTDALHELGTPRLNLLKAHNVRARRPIELQHLDIDCRSGLDLALPIPPRNRADPSLVFFNVHDIHSPTSLNRTRQ